MNGSQHHGTNRHTTVPHNAALFSFTRRTGLVLRPEKHAEIGEHWPRSRRLRAWGQHEERQERSPGLLAGAKASRSIQLQNPRARHLLTRRRNAAIGWVGGYTVGQNQVILGHLIIHFPTISGVMG